MKRTFFPEKGEYFLALPGGRKIKINYWKREKNINYLKYYYLKN